MLLSIWSTDFGFPDMDHPICLLMLQRGAAKRHAHAARTAAAARKLGAGNGKNFDPGIRQGSDFVIWLRVIPTTQPGRIHSVLEPSFHCSRCAAIALSPPQRMRRT